MFDTPHKREDIFVHQNTYFRDIDARPQSESNDSTFWEHTNATYAEREGLPRLVIFGFEARMTGNSDVTGLGKGCRQSTKWPADSGVVSTLAISGNSKSDDNSRHPRSLYS